MWQEGERRDVLPCVAPVYHAAEGITKTKRGHRNDSVQNQQDGCPRDRPEPRPGHDWRSRDGGDREQETPLLFDTEFGLQARKIRELFSLRGLTDRDLDAFYRHPSSAFEIDVIARRLIVLSRRLERT